jgi:alkylation response protein AidB-like acyl-CoA dehydrogenase
MDFNDSAEQADFRAQVRNWLDENATRRSDAVQIMRGQDSAGGFERARDWYRKVAQAGYACISWPVEHGGAGLSQIHQVIWSQEVASYDTPDGYFVIGIGNCGPAIQAFASEALKRELLPRMASAEHVWCQLFSEPAAGSDVAGLRTRAQPSGDEWIINGQKIWTSGAQHSDYGVILTRTDPTVAKYRGLTLFMIDLRQSGVQVKPIKQMDGGQHFNEVYFTDAVVPDAYRLGEVGGGWGAALHVLMNERMAISGVQPNGFPQFLHFCQHTVIDGQRVIDDPVVQDKLATWYAQDAGLRNANWRMLTAIAKGGMPGAEASLGKLVGAVMNQEIANFSVDLCNEAGAIVDDELNVLEGNFQRSLMFAPGIRLAGGTDEVMRNIIAEQVLGLPQEPRVDKGVPFNEIPTGSH